MHTYTLLLLFFLMTTIFSVPLKAEKQITPANTYPDSLLTVAHIRQIAMNDPDQALLMLDQAEKHKLIPLYQINWTRAQIFGGPKQMGRIALNWAEIVLQDDSVRNKPARYVNMCRNIISQLIYFKEYEKALHYVDNMLQIAEQEPSILQRIRHDAYWSIAYVYRMTGNQKEAYKSLDQAIEAVKISGIQAPANYMDMHKFYFYKSGWLQEDRKYEEALRSALVLKDLLEKMEPYKGGPFPKKIPDQNYQEYEAQTMLKLANLYQLTGQESKGKELYESLEHNPSLKNSEPVINQVVNYLLNANRNQEGIDLVLPLADAGHYSDDTINVKRLNACRILANAYQKEGNYREAIEYAQQVFILYDSLKRRHQENDALELATLLETHEKEKMISNQADEIRIHKIISYAACIMLGLCCLILMLYIRHSRIINRKNKAMAKQIDNRLFYKEELLKAHEQIHQLEEKLQAQTESRLTMSDDAALSQEMDATAATTTEPKETTYRTNSSQATDAMEAEEEAKKNDKRLFEELDRKIRKDNLYLNPDLNREQILQLT